MSTIILILILIFALVLFSFLINMKWLMKTLREIAKDECGYTKLIQISLIALLIITFLTIIIYYLFHPSQVDRIDIILTVVVGWLGAIIGNFFGEKAMGNLEDKRDINVISLHDEIRHKDIIMRNMEELLKKDLKKK